MNRDHCFNCKLAYCRAGAFCGVRSADDLPRGWPDDVTYLKHRIVFANGNSPHLGSRVMAKKGQSERALDKLEIVLLPIVGYSVRTRDMRADDEDDFAFRADDYLVRLVTILLFCFDLRVVKGSCAGAREHEDLVVVADRRYLVGANAGFHTNAERYGNIVRFINGSKSQASANARLCKPDRHGDVHVFANCDIPFHTHITLDYGPAYWRAQGAEPISLPASQGSHPPILFLPHYQDSVADDANHGHDDYEREGDGEWNDGRSEVLTPVRPKRNRDARDDVAAAGLDGAYWNLDAAAPATGATHWDPVLRDADLFDDDAFVDPQPPTPRAQRRPPLPPPPPPPPLMHEQRDGGDNGDELVRPAPRRGKRWLSELHSDLDGRRWN